MPAASGPITAKFNLLKFAGIHAAGNIGEWGKVFPDRAMTLAAIDRLVHHATILEMNVESYRRNAALERKRGKGRPAAHATSKTKSD